MENKAHYARSVTQGEDALRIRIYQLLQVFAVTRNFALNVYHDNVFANMA